VDLLQRSSSLSASVAAAVITVRPAFAEARLVGSEAASKKFEWGKGLAYLLRRR